MKTCFRNIVRTLFGITFGDFVERILLKRTSKEEVSIFSVEDKLGSYCQYHLFRRYPSPHVKRFLSVLTFEKYISNFGKKLWVEMR